MPSAESLVDLHEAAASEKDDVDSLPSDSTSELYSEADSDAQAEWERSLEQLQLLLTMLIVPWMGKYFGRKFAYWSKPFPRHSCRPLSALRPNPKFHSRGWLTRPHRLGAIHGMGTRNRGPMDEQEGLQGCWSCRSSHGLIRGIYHIQASLYQHWDQIS